MKKLLLFFISLLIASQLAAQDFSAISEAMAGKDYEKAVSLTSEQIALYPKTSELYIYRAQAYKELEKYGKVLNDVEKAIQFRTKRDSFSLSSLYSFRASTYLIIGDTLHALSDLNSAVKVDPKKPECYFQRALLLTESREYAAAEADFVKALEICPYSTDVEMEYVKCLMLQNKNVQAAEHCKNLVRLSPKDPDVRLLMSELCLKNKDDEGYIEHFVEYMDLLQSYRLDTLIEHSSRAYDYTVKVIEEKIETSTDKGFLLSVLIRVNMSNERYKEAITNLTRLKEIDTNSDNFLFINYNLGLCYARLFEYIKAINFLTLTIEEEESRKLVDYDDYVLRGICYEGVGQLDKALADYNTAISHNSRNSGYYKRRAILNTKQKEYASAKRDFDKAIEFDENNDYSIWLLRGKLLLQNLGDTLSAKNDFIYVIAFDTVVRPGTVREQALHFLGKDTEAEAWIGKMLKLYPDKNTVCYQAACIYSLINKPEEAIKYLNKALELGFRNILNILYDTDLDNIHDRDDFKEIIDKYRKKEMRDAFESLLK